MEDNVIELTKGNFDSFTKQGWVLVDFYAEWCMPCVMMEPVVEEVSESFNGKIKFGKMNVEESEAIAQKFKVSSIPNFVLLKDGQIVTNFLGSMSVEEMQEKLNKFLK